MEKVPYTREELLGMDDSRPERGPVCPKCGQHIPQFDLPAEALQRIRKLVDESRPTMAMQELRQLTGCPLSWAKLWVVHRGRPDAMGTSAPCPYCGKALATALAKQCPHCYMDWHDAERPRNLRDSPWIPKGE